MLLISLTILTSSVIILFLVFNKKTFLSLSICLILIFSVIQIKQTKPTNFFQLNEMETIDQINRMHQYPSSAFRLGHIIEERPESIIFFKLEKNFTDTFDFLLFSNYFLTIILLPFFIIGFFKSIQKDPVFSISLITIPIILFTLIGHQNSNGPICLYPIIFAYSFFSLFPQKFFIKTK